MATDIPSDVVGEEGTASRLGPGPAEPPQLVPTRRPSGERSGRSDSGLGRIGDLDEEARTVGKYRLLARLGKGGMGDVFLAEDRSGHRVALKLLSAALEDPSLRRRFEREGEVLAKLEHPSIVSIVDRGVEPGSNRPWLALELLAGRDLEALLQRRPGGRLTIPEATYVLARCAEALESAHARGVIHRDVKPANLILTAHGDVKLGDFGLALTQDVSMRLTIGEVLGTPAYLAPEVLMGEAWTFAADLYALGAVAFRLLAGRPLFQGTDVAEVMCDQITRTPPSLQEERPEVPRELAELVTRLLSKDPAVRPTAPEVAHKLAAAAPEPAALRELWGEALAELPKPDSGAMALGSLRRLRGGQTFLHYRIEQEVGRGGMGIVYRAWHFGLKRMVALKVLLAGALATDADRRRFLREAQAAGDLSHPAVVPVLDAGEHEGTWYITMAYVEGTPLGRWLEQGPTPEARLRLFVRMCDGIQHAHTRGVIHRDLKPDNVLVGADQQPFILDFGVAKRVDQDEDHTTDQTTDGSLLGTLRYMAPEQASGAAREVDVRSDVWSLGTILYEMLARTTPFRGTLREVLHGLHFGEVAAPSTHDPRVPWELDAICLKALEKDKEARYQSARELQADVQRHLEGLPIQARRATGWYVARKWVARHRSRVIAAGAAGALVLLLAGGWAWERSAARRVARERVVAHTAEAWAALAAGQPQEALVAFSQARERIGPEDELPLPQATLAHFLPEALAQLEPDERTAPRVTLARLRDWSSLARRQVDRGEALRALSFARGLLEAGDAREAARKVQLAAGFSDGPDVRALARKVSDALRTAAALELAGAAEQELQARRGGVDRALSLLEEAQRIDPESAEVRAALAGAWAAQGELSQLERERHLREQSSRLVGQGQELLAKGDLDGARRAFEQALGFDGGSRPARDGLLEVGRALAAAREAERTAADRTRALDLVEEGKRALAEGDVERARTSFTQALGFDGGSVEAQAGLFQVYRLDQVREEERGAVERRQRLVAQLERGERLHEEARQLYRDGDLPERVREAYFAAMEAYRQALLVVPTHPQAAERLRGLAREFSLVLVDQGYPELAGFILRLGGVEEEGPVRGEPPRDPLLTVVESDQVNARQAFGKVHFFPSAAFDRLREYVRSQTDKLSFVIEVRSEVVQNGPHPQLYLRELRVKMLNRPAGTWTVPEVIPLEGKGPFLRPVSVDTQGRRVVRSWDQSHGVDAKAAIRRVENVVQRLVRDTKHQAERAAAKQDEEKKK